MRLDFGKASRAAPGARNPELPFLWQVQFDRCCIALLDQIYRTGLPVRYDYVPEALPLDLYQTVYAGEPGSVEMPSAGRAFSWELLFKLRRQGIGLASLSLHTGLSSTRDDALDATHPVYPEEFEIPVATAKAVNAAHGAAGGGGGRDDERRARPGNSRPRRMGRPVRPVRGWTRLHIDAATGCGPWTPC